jgi:hypothetical protein
MGMDAHGIMESWMQLDAHGCADAPPREGAGWRWMELELLLLLRWDHPLQRRSRDERPRQPGARPKMRFSTRRQPGQPR